MQNSVPAANSDGQIVLSGKNFDLENLIKELKSVEK